MTCFVRNCIIVIQPSTSGSSTVWTNLIGYQRGFTNVITTGDFEIMGDTETIEADNIKNQGLSFLLGYVF
ncbi:MAG: hypothetical protein KAJ37_09775 [Candidatus Krumholzibacteria bacterium]|nr:hypothetical protein [Candidatus Krumholzibacteria bacterium]